MMVYDRSSDSGGGSSDSSSGESGGGSSDSSSGESGGEREYADIDLTPLHLFADQWHLRIHGAVRRGMERTRDIGSVKLNKSGRGKLELIVYGDQRAKIIEITADETGDVRKIEILGFFYETKEDHPVEYERIMHVIKKVLNRTPLGFLNDATNTLKTLAGADGHEIDLVDEWEGKSAGDLSVDVDESGQLTGAYTVVSTADGREDITSDDLKMVAIRAIATSRLDTVVVSLVRPQNIKSDGGITCPIDEIKVSQDGTWGLVNTSSASDFIICEAIANEKTTAISIKYCLPSRPDDVRTEIIACGGGPALGKTGPARLGWTERMFKIYDRIKDDDLESIVEWGYYGKLYGTTKSLRRGYSEMLMPFTDTAALVGGNVICSSSS